MRVFVTGASGHIGIPVVDELIGAGHKVIGLARSDAGADRLAVTGATVHRGDLDDLDDLAEQAAAADGVIHLAFKHEAMAAGDFGGAIAADLAVVNRIGDALAGTDKPFINTAGTLMLAMSGLTRTGTEADVLAAGLRVDSENAVIELADKGVRSAVIRLPPTVHSSLDHHGFVPTLITIARDKGVAGYLGDGANRWPAVHTLDAAHLYRLALESAPAGSRLHATDDEGVPFREIAAFIGQRLDVPVASIPAEQAEAHFGFLAGLVGLDNPTSSAHTRELLGWRPTRPALLADLADGHYFG